MLHNEYLLDFIGKSKTNKLNSEIEKFVAENNSCFYKPMSIIDVHKPNQNEILGLGISIPNDLILDNFGIWLSHFIGCIGTTNSMKDDGNTIRQIRLPHNNGSMSNTVRIDQVPPNPDFNPLGGTYFRLGDSDVSPLRTDFNVGSTLPNSPESSLQGTNVGGFNSGLGTVTASKTYPSTSGVGIIKELGTFIRFNENTIGRNYMLSHDLISPVVNYGIGDIINVEIKWQI